MTVKYGSLLSIQSVSSYRNVNKFGGVNIPLDTAGNQGLFYYLGTIRNTQAWANPSPSYLTWTASGQFAGSTVNLTDRSGSEFDTANVSSSWVKVDLGVGKSLNPSHMRIQQRPSGVNLYGTVVVEGSNDNSAWTQLGTVTSVAAVGEWDTVVLTGQPYRYFRATQTSADRSGNNYFCIGEIELFGFFNG